MNLDIKTTEIGASHYIVSLFGEIDAYTAPQLKDTLLSLIEKQGQLIEVDLQQVNYMDSTGLGVFISALKSTKENGGEVRLIHLQERVRRLFTITGLDSVITIDSTVRGGN
ncbi:STAS domain-containing protein [Aquibacillus sediminis]|uniref:STAS domain-containing protein n=1 Tax=Aquibacillus sediminis TaxID=2574734 RepID=UPI0011095C41|nr:STAS domain-containing protein [Aquibacillus sediminis]